jgi:hypothetical protein
VYNSRFRVCHAGDLLMGLNFPLYAVEYASCTSLKDVSAISCEPATTSARSIVFASPSAIPAAQVS